MDHILKHIRILVSWTTITMLVLCCSCNRRAYTYNKPASITEDTVYIELNVMAVVDTGYVYGILRKVEAEFKKQNFCDRIHIKQFTLNYSDTRCYISATNYYVDIAEMYPSASSIPYGVFIYNKIPILCSVDSAHQKQICKSSERMRTIGLLLNDVDVFVDWSCILNSEGNIISSYNEWKTLSRDPDYEREMKEFCKYGYLKKRRR